MASFVIRMKFHKNKLLTTGVAVALALAVGACSSSSDDDEMALMMNGDDDAMNGDADAMNGDADAMNGDADAMNGDADAMNGDADAMNGDGDAKTPAETLADARAALMALPDDATDEAKEMAQELVDVALRLPGNEAELITSLDAKVAQAEGRQSALDLTEQERQANAVTLQNAEAALTSASAEAKEAAQATVDEALQLPGNEAALIASLKKEITDQAQTVADAAAKAGLADRIAREDAVKKAIVVSKVDATAVTMPSGGDVTGVTATRNPAGMVTVDVNGEVADDYTGGETTAGSGDWNSATLTKGTNTLVVYTNIEAPSDQDFADAYDRTTVLNDALLAATVGKVASAGFPSEPDTSWDYTGVEGGRAKTVTGTFDGVPGQFTCTADTCTVDTDAMGKLEGVANWEFRADSQNTATVKKPDAAYAYFGWWLDKPEDNTMPHMVQVFAGAVGEAAVVDSAIMGTAKYAGPAAGKYVTKTFTAGVQTDAGVGHFTANAALTAKFGDAVEMGTIDGSVTGFVLDTGASPTWKVILEEVTLLQGNATFSGMTEVDFGGGATTNDAGAWQGSFYDAAPATPAGGAPGTVAGTFDAVTENASVIGGFGATKQ